MQNVDKNTCIHPKVYKVIQCKSILSLAYIAIERYHPLKIGKHIAQYSSQNHWIAFERLIAAKRTLTESLKL